MNVKSRAEAVGTFRHVNVVLMETLAAWIPGTPEMEVKVLFGRHLWLVAQMADRLGRRARELRAPLHYSRAPSAGHAAALAGLAALASTAARLAGFHGVALDALGQAYSGYLARTDGLIDEPTVAILQDALRDIGRMRDESGKLLDEFPRLREGAAEGTADLRRLYAGAGDMVQAHAESQPA